MNKRKFNHPEIRKKYKNNAKECINLYIEKQSIIDNMSTLDEFIRLTKIKKRINKILDYQIENYKKANHEKEH